MDTGAKVMNALQAMHSLKRLYKKRDALEWAINLLKKSKQEDPATLHLSGLEMVYYDLNEAIKKLETAMKSAEVKKSDGEGV